MRWEEPQFGQASVAGLAGTAGEAAAAEDREEAREPFERDLELTEDAEVDFIASTLG
jgi:F420-0:gamma-glutamyl ligase